MIIDVKRLHRYADLQPACTSEFLHEFANEIERLRKEVKKLNRQLKYADEFRLTREEWEKKWGKDAR
jgi:hypothetical protein